MMLRRRLLPVALALPLLAGCVEGLFFHPSRGTPPPPAGAVELHFPAADGVRLHGWWLPATGAPRGTVVHAHGNAANVANHHPLVAWLPAHGWNVLMFDYRGFGRSDGSPTLNGAVEDLLGAMATARRQPGVDAARLVVLGQSLGGATAIRAVARDAAGVRLLIVDSAFDSYRGIARDAAGGTPLALLAPLLTPMLPADTDDPITAVGRLDVPLLLLHGDRDRVIPPAHSERLQAAARGPRELIRVAGGQHLDALMRQDVRERVLAAMHDAQHASGAAPARE